MDRGAHCAFYFARFAAVFRQARRGSARWCGWIDLSAHAHSLRGLGSGQFLIRLGARTSVFVCSSDVFSSRSCLGVDFRGPRLASGDIGCPTVARVRVLESRYDATRAFDVHSVVKLGCGRLSASRQVFPSQSCCSVCTNSPTVSNFLSRRN